MGRWKLRLGGGWMLVVLAVAGTARAEGLQWAASFPDALKQAKQSKKLVMIDFYTDWCGWCKRLDKDTYGDKRVVAALRDVISCKVNGDHDKASAQRYGVRGYPAIIFVDGDGTKVGEIRGYVPPDAFLQQFNQIAADFRSQGTLEAALAKNEADVEAATKLIELYGRRGNIEGVRKVVGVLERTGGGRVPADAYVMIGEHLRSKGQCAEAMPYYEKALASKASPAPRTTAYAHLGAAVCCYHLKRKDDSARHLDAVIGMKGRIEDGLHAQAVSLRKQLDEGA